jgi:uncharacterized protein (TIGR03085 family)
MERAALADLFAAVGPDVPTLCEGWTSRELLAHLIVRERHVAAAGIRISSLAAWTASVQHDLAARPYAELIGKFRHPAWWSLLSNGPADELLNLAEFFIHHEDVRRAQPQWSVRELPGGEATGLWSRLPFVARTMKNAPGTVSLVAPGYGELVTGKGGDAVSITGEPGELLIFVSGRQAHARVTLAGPDHVITKLTTKKMAY